MGNWAYINQDRVVTQIIVADEDFILSGAVGNPNNWIEYSITGEFRKNPASIGGKYDLMRNAFLYVKPYPSWILNEETCQWESPITKPNDGKYYQWDENNLNWILSE